MASEIKLSFQKKFVIIVNSQLHFLIGPDRSLNKCDDHLKKSILYSLGLCLFLSVTLYAKNKKIRKGHIFFHSTIH